MEPDPVHIGRRVTVRTRIRGRGPSGGPAMSDVVGHVEAVDGQTVTVRRSSGDIAVIPRGSIVVFHLIEDR